MSDPISVTITNAQPLSVSISGASSPDVQITNGGGVNVAVGQVAPGDATVLAGTVQVGNVTTLAPGSSATVSQVGTGSLAVLDFGIPTGAAGPQGPAGQNGANGINGINGTMPTFSIDTVSTLAAGSSANVTLTTSNGGANVSLSFGIPQGASGTNGTAGSSDWSSLANVPSNFPTNTTLVSGLQAALDGKQAAGNYVTGVNNLTGNLTLAAGSNITITPSGSTLTIAASGGGIGANDPVDGGDYVGELLYGITFTTQPQNTSSSSLPGNWTTGGNVPVGVSSEGLVYQGGKFLALWRTGDTSGGLYTSTDGASWTQSSALTASDGWYHLGNANNRLFVTRYTVNPSTSTVWSSVDDGATWSSLSGVDFFFRSVAYGASRYVAVGLSAGGVDTQEAKTSSDGVAWTTRTLPYSGMWNAVVRGNGVFCALGMSGGGAATKFSATSTDGITWTGATHSASAPMLSLAYGAGRFVGVGGGTGVCGVSTDGLTWTFSSLPVAAMNVIYEGGMFVCACPNGTDVLTSPDGLTWTVGTLPVSAIWNRVAYGNNRYVAIGSLPATPPATIPDTTRSVSMVPVGASATFSVSASASSGNPVSYQWQRSLDAGTSWANVANATTSALNLTGLTQADNGTRYRALASATGATPATSQSAILTVTG